MWITRFLNAVTILMFLSLFSSATLASSDQKASLTCPDLMDNDISWNSWKDNLLGKVSDSFQLERINQNTDLKWAGPAGDSSTLPNISARLKAQRLHYDLKHQHRAPVEVIFGGILPGLISEQARRHIISSQEMSQVNLSLEWLEILTERPEELLSVYSDDEIKLATLNSFRYLELGLKRIMEGKVQTSPERAPWIKTDTGTFIWPQNERLAEEIVIVELLADVFQQAYHVTPIEKDARVVDVLSHLILTNGFFDAGVTLAIRDLVTEDQVSTLDVLVQLKSEVDRVSRPETILREELLRPSIPGILVRDLRRTLLKWTRVRQTLE